MIRPQEIITVKRDGGELSKEHIESFIDGVCNGAWADYQITALVMAIFTRGITEAEQADLTYAMLHSGETLDLADITKPKGDKHSTGGVGDKTSLIIAPVLAACGVAVPMISGRGLGHTGGTLDKLESIPGYLVGLSTKEFKDIVAKNGYAMAGQTADIVPADKKLYALRDATATVPYIPLIVASIMSKKLAEDLDALVLDVKTGSGAFMQRYEDSVTLAKALCKTGERFGVRTEAVISDMSQPLGKWIGNAHEVVECIEILSGNTQAGAESTLELSVELTANLLVTAGIAGDTMIAKQMIADKLSCGEALEKFRENIKAQGGDPNVCDDPQVLIDKSLIEFPVISQTSGYVSAIDAASVGNAICAIGGGRTRAEDEIDHAVGFASLAKIGDEIRSGEAVGILYCRNTEQAESAAARLRESYSIDTEKHEAQPLIHTTISAKDLI